VTHQALFDARVGTEGRVRIVQGIIIPTLIGAVTLALALGLINMLRGGNADRSQRLMRWRVGLQFLAIVAIMGYLWFNA
jgi:hypothetical protein